MDQKLRTERRKLADLKAAEYNPRKALTPDDAEYQKIRRSIEEFGYVDPIIINEDGTIIGGHQRATVLKDLGYQEVDVVVVALDKQREKALNIALNKITGEWDEVKLKDLLLDLDLGDYDISLTGFEQNDLTELVDKLAIEPEAVDDDFNEDEALEQAEAEPVTKLGDVWLLGRHRLMCGDSTSQDDFYRVEVIASLFGVTVRRVQQLTQEGIISTTKTKEGNRYELAPTIQRYVKYLSDKAYGKSKSEKEAELREQKLQAEIALKESQGEMHRLKTEIASGKYIDIEEVKMDYSRFFVSFKKFALSLPSRLSGRISGHCDPMEIRSIEKDLNAEIIRLLNSFVVAGCTPEEMEKKKRGKKSVS